MNYEFGDPELTHDERLKAILMSEPSAENNRPTLYDDCSNCGTSLENAVFGFEFRHKSASTLRDVWRSYYYCTTCDTWVWQCH